MKYRCLFGVEMQNEPGFYIDGVEKSLIYIIHAFIANWLKIIIKWDLYTIHYIINFKEYH